MGARILLEEVQLSGKALNNLSILHPILFGIASVVLPKLRFGCPPFGTRSSIGYYLFSPPGENERQLTVAGFSVLYAKDTTANAAEISTRWRQGRENSKAELIALEGETNFEGLQQFLRCVQALTSERRLLRYLYLAQKSQQ